MHACPFLPIMNWLLEDFLAGIQAGARQVLVPVTSARIRQQLPEMRTDGGARSTARAGKWCGLAGLLPLRWWGQLYKPSSSEAGFQRGAEGGECEKIRLESKG